MEQTTDLNKYDELKELLTRKEKARTEFDKQIPLIIEWFINKMNHFFECDQGSIRYNEFYKEKKYKFNITIRIPYETDDPFKNQLQIKDFEFSFYFISPDSSTLYSEDLSEKFKEKGVNINEDLNDIFEQIYQHIRDKIANSY